jgi:tRNA pseudouridine55 synthase
MLNWTHVDTLTGVLVVDKPSGWTSHDVVNKARRFTGTRKVGHLGTLDPDGDRRLAAVGGSRTRLAQFFGKADKVYESRWSSATSRTLRRGGKAHLGACRSDPRLRRIEPLLDRFRGTDPADSAAVSAKKIQGTPAYKLARKNVAVR